MKQFSIGESLLHEASHNSFLRSKTWNKRAQIFLAYPFLLTLNAYRNGHLPHHRFYNTSKDPLAIKLSKYRFLSEYFFIEWYIIPIFGGRAVYFCRDILYRIKSKDRKEVAIFWFVVLCIALFYEITYEVFLYWLVPLFWCYSSLIFWSRLTDHYKTITGTRSSTSWIYNKLISHNGGYHAIHHKIPHVPYYLLPKLSRTLSSEILSDYSSGMHDTYKNIKEKYNYA